MKNQKRETITIKPIFNFDGVFGTDSQPTFTGKWRVLHNSGSQDFDTYQEAVLFTSTFRDAFIEIGAAGG